MKVMQIEGAWGPENIRPAERPDPVPGPGEVVIRMRAVSINPRDLIMSQGGYGRRGGSLPLVPLCDGAGEVAALGAGVSRAQLGDLVCPTYSRAVARDAPEAPSVESPAALCGVLCRRPSANRLRAREGIAGGQPSEPPAATATRA